MKEGDVVYSLDQEHFAEIGDIMDQIDPKEYGEGDIVHAWKGVIKPLKHVDMLDGCRSIPEHIMDAAYDIDGDWAEDYLVDMTPEIEKGLLAAMAEYLDKHCASPQYFRVDQIEKFDIVVTDIIE